MADSSEGAGNQTDCIVYAEEVLVPIDLLHLFAPCRMHQAVSRRWQSGLFVTFSHDYLIGSRILLLLVAAPVVLVRSSCMVACEVVI